MAALSYTDRFDAYQRRLFALDNLDRETEADLARRWRDGDTRAGQRLVEHNLKVVAGLSDTITVLTRGQVLAEGDYAAVSANPEVKAAYLGADDA